MMIHFNVNEIMDRLQGGEITKRQALDMTCSFICENYKVFGLERHDEDFRSELILSLLEKGERLIDGFNPALGDYFTYLFMTVESHRRARIRTAAKKQVHESFVMQTGPLYLAEKECDYAPRPFTPVSAESKRPLAYKPVPADTVRKTLTALAHQKQNKKLLILAIKTAFYLSDEQVRALSAIYRIPEERFHQIIQFFKNHLMDKSDRKRVVEERRNTAYFRQKNYEKRLEIIRGSERHYDNRELLLDLERTLAKHQRRCDRLNRKLRDGCVLVRPTNKMIADYLGICERQVAYYISRCRDEADG